MSTSYTLMNIRERGVYYGGDRYRVFYTVSQAATLMNMNKSNLAGRVKRNTVEHILLTDWNRKDTLDRPMIEERVIIYEKEKLLAKKENRKVEMCHYKQIIVTVSEQLSIFLPASCYSLVGDLVHEYEGKKITVDYHEEEIDPDEEEPLKDIAEIYLKDNDIVQAIPYSIKKRYSAKRKKVFESTKKFDIYVILQLGDCIATATISLKDWLKVKKQILNDRNFDSLPRLNGFLINGIF